MKKILATLTLAAFALTVAPAFGQSTPQEPAKTEKKQKTKKKKEEPKKEETKK